MKWILLLIASSLPLTACANRGNLKTPTQAEHNAAKKAAKSQKKALEKAEQEETPEPTPPTSPLP